LDSWNFLEHFFCLQDSLQDELYDQALRLLVGDAVSEANATEAGRLLEAACALRHPRASAFVGFCCINPFCSIRYDPRRGCRLLERAAYDLSDPVAMAVLSAYRTQVKPLNTRLCKFWHELICSRMRRRQKEPRRRAKCYVST
jgi:hypothetical protein